MNNMGINASAFGKLMRMLAQYENAPAAVIREYVSNAVDAVRGLKNGHVDIILPTMDNNTFEVRDNGCGMSYDFMDNELCNYLTSTKSNNGKSIGSKGIGSKAAFSISDKFSITSVQDGIRTTCVYHINDNDECGYDISSQDAPGEANGTIVSVIIKDGYSIDRMKTSASKVLQGFDRDLISVSDQHGDDVFIDYFDGTNRVRINDAVSINTKDNKMLSVVQGNVWYDLNGSALYDMLRDYMCYDYPKSGDRAEIQKVDDIKTAMNTNYFFGYMFPNIVISLEGNALTTNPSRESFEATKQNMNVILDAIHTMYDTVGDDETRVIDIMNHVMDSKAFKELDYDDALRVCHAVVGSMNVAASHHGDITIGGEPFITKTVRSHEPIIEMKKRKDTKNSNYEINLVSHANDDDGTYHYHMNASYNNTVNIFVSDVDDIDEAKRIVRSRRIWANETNVVDNPYDIMRFVFTKTDIHNDIPFWLDKGESNVFITAKDYEAVLESRSARMKKEAAERRKNSNSQPAVKSLDTIKVSVMVFNGSNMQWSRSMSTSLASAIGYDNSMSIDNDSYSLLRAGANNPADREKAMAIKQGVKNIGLIANMEHSGGFGYESVTVVCRKGSKANMKIMDDVLDSYQDVLDRSTASIKDPNSPASRVYDEQNNKLIQSECRRITSNMMHTYHSYHDVLGMLGKASESITSKDTRDVIETMVEASRTPSGNWLDSSGYMKNVQALESLGIKGQSEYHNDERIHDIENAIGYFNSRYPIISALGLDAMSPQNNRIGLIVDYINTCDKSARMA